MDGDQVLEDVNGRERERERVWVEGGRAGLGSVCCLRWGGGGGKGSGGE